MLKSLFIKDYVLIDNLSIQFDKGLNIITGETGAGKSIIIDAMNLVIGERASTELIRKGCEKSIIEGLFDIRENEKVKEFLTQKEFDLADELIIRREINIKGNSRCFVNDSPATLNDLKDLGKFIIDLHGQHEHQTLLRTETHIDMLDSFGYLETSLKEYQKYYYEINTLYKKINELKAQEKVLKEKKEFYVIQLKEINSVDPKNNEDDELNTGINILENSEKLFEHTNSIYDLYYGSDSSVYDQLIKIRNLLEDLIKIDGFFIQISKENSSMISVVDDLAKTIQSYSSKLEFSQESLDSMRERQGKLNNLVKRYGGSIAKVIEYKNKIEKEVILANNFEEEIEKLYKDVHLLINKCTEQAQVLSAKRKETANKISYQIVEVLKELGISYPQFEVSFFHERTKNKDSFIKINNEYYEANSKGYDFIEFFISTNAGESPKSLVKVASGGEISRIMLSLKTILAKSDKLPLMVFDEIDVGISGRVAQKVGNAMKNLAQYHQIISITHLPQIAGFADSHYVVEKIHQNDNTFSTMRKLSMEERIIEVAKLLSGEIVTGTSMETAKELIGLK